MLFPTRSSFIKRSSSLSKQTTMVFDRAHLDTLWRAHLRRRRLPNGGERDDDAIFAKYEILLKGDARDLDVETLRYVHEEKSCRFRPESLPIAVERSNGTVEIVRYYAQHVPVEMLLEHEKMVKRATMFACKLGYFKVLKCLVEILRTRAPNVFPWSPWCLFWARRENHQACLNFCLENGCPEYHDQNECHSRYIVGEPIRNGLPHYRKCARRREGGASYCCKNHRTCCACAGFGRVMETVKTALGSFQKKKRAARVEVAASSFPWKTTLTTNPTKKTTLTTMNPTQKKKGEKRQTRTLGAHKTKKKERKKEKERKPTKKGEPFSVAKKKGEKKTSLTWSLL